MESFTAFLKGVCKPQQAAKYVKVAPTATPTSGLLHASLDLHFWGNPTYARLRHLFSFLDLVQQPPPVTILALETPHEELYFKSKLAAPSNAKLLSASTPKPPSITQNQQPSSFKSHNKQAPPPSQQTQHVPGWEFFFGKT